MTDVSDPRGDGEHRQVSQMLRVELAKRRMTQDALAAVTGLSLATIGRALRGKFRAETIMLIESKLEISLGAAPRRDQHSMVAAEQLGSYHFQNVSHLVGEYLCARRAFSKPDDLVLYPITISWTQQPAQLAGLRFDEINKIGKVDYSQSGHVYLPPGCSYLHLATVDRGSVRLITVSFVPDKLIEDEALRGLILTLYNPVASSHVPAVSPFVMLKVGADDKRRQFHGVYAASDRRFGFIVEELEVAEQQQAQCVIRGKH